MTCFLTNLRLLKFHQMTNKIMKKYPQMTNKMWKNPLQKVELSHLNPKFQRHCPIRKIHSQLACHVSQVARQKNANFNNSSTKITDNNNSSTKITTTTTSIPMTSVRGGLKKPLSYKPLTNNSNVNSPPTGKTSTQIPRLVSQKSV